jgi:hypothetical protein
MAPAITNIPSVGAPVISTTFPTRYALRIPPRLPSELISAIPVAAAGPRRSIGGSDQNTGRQPIVPVEASAMDASASVVSEAKTALRMYPMF